MPRVKLNEKPRDRVKELILGEKNRLEYDNEQMARLMGVSKSTYERRMSQTSDEWQMKELKKLCKALYIPVDELREAIRYEALS